MTPEGDAHVRVLVHPRVPGKGFFRTIPSLGSGGIGHARCPRWISEDVDLRDCSISTTASARRLAARSASDALELFTRLPNVDPTAIEDAKATFSRWEDTAVAQLTELDSNVNLNRRQLQHEQAETLIRLSSMEVLDQLAEIGLLPKALANRAAETITGERRTNDIR